MLKKMKDPVSSLTHLVGALLSVGCTATLVRMAYAREDRLYVVAFLIFGMALILLYSASALYHMLPLSEKASTILRRIDHMMIFVLIAGTYTPVCLVPLRGPWGWTLLSLIWTLAFAGIILKAYWLNAPRWLSTAIYLVMGWLVLAAFYPLAQSVSAEGLWLLVLGGVAYSVGAVIYALKWPRFLFKGFGFHEIFHLFVLGGSYFHVTFMFRYVLGV